jgi:hypothetical protein
MAFYGSGAGLSNLASGNTNSSATSTTSNRQLSSSFVTHLSRTLTVSSGHTAHVICIGHFAQAYEQDAGAYEVRCVVSGSASVTGTTYTNHRGHHSHNAGSCQPCWSFTLGAGSYTFSLQAREWNGYVELNRHDGSDMFMVHGYQVRD